MRECVCAWEGRGSSLSSQKGYKLNFARPTKQEKKVREFDKQNKAGGVVCVLNRVISDAQ